MAYKMDNKIDPCIRFAYYAMFRIWPQGKTESDEMWKIGAQFGLFNHRGWEAKEDIVVDTINGLVLHLRLVQAPLGHYTIGW